MRDRDSTSQRACKPQNAALNQQKLSTLPDTYQAKLWQFKGTVQACLNPHSVDKKKKRTAQGPFQQKGFGHLQTNGRPEQASDARWME